MTVGSTERAPATLDDVPGWFPAVDQALFRWFLDQQSTGDPGDLLELGAYLGKSAIVIGEYLRRGETFTVCDRFDPSYVGLTKQAFERNYLAFHAELPVVVQASTSEIRSHVKPATCRFVHIDASHYYDDVAADIATTRDLLLPGGLVVFDDFRTAHTPGVAAAVWEAVLQHDLKPICVTWQKLYGTWGDPAPAQQALIAWLEEREELLAETQVVAGHRLVRVWPKSKSTDADRCRRCGASTTAPAQSAGKGAKPVKAPKKAKRSKGRQLAIDLMPPMLTRAIRRMRRAAKA